MCGRRDVWFSAVCTWDRCIHVTQRMLAVWPDVRSRNEGCALIPLLNTCWSNCATTSCAVEVRLHYYGIYWNNISVVLLQLDSKDLCRYCMFQFSDVLKFYVRKWKPGGSFITFRNKITTHSFASEIRNYSDDEFVHQGNVIWNTLYAYDTPYTEPTVLATIYNS